LSWLSCERIIKRRNESGMLSQPCAYHVLRGALNNTLHFGALTATGVGLWRTLAEVVRGLSVLEAAGAIADVDVEFCAAIANVELRHKALAFIAGAGLDTCSQGSSEGFIVLSWTALQVLDLEVVVDILTTQGQW
jgi:hypothetical protein